MTLEYSGQVKKLYFYQNDPNGMPLRLIDENGIIKWEGHYSAFGLVDRVSVEAVGQPLRLQGQYFDTESGLCYNRHRYYDAGVGWFVSADPIGLVGGLNTYQFATNVLKWVDPLGLQCLVRFKRWKVGDAIDKPLPNGSTPSWDVVRSRYWKNRAAAVVREGIGEFDAVNLSRMRLGRAALEANGNPLELHHMWTPQRVGGSQVNSPLNLVEVTREQHAVLDPFRHLAGGS